MNRYFILQIELSGHVLFQKNIFKTSLKGGQEYNNPFPDVIRIPSCEITIKNILLAHKSSNPQEGYKDRVKNGRP